MAFGIFSKKKKEKETNNKITPELREAIDACRRNSEGETLVAGYGAVLYAYNKILTEKNITKWSFAVSRMLLTKGYDITTDEHTKAWIAGWDCAKLYYQIEDPNLIELTEMIDLAPELSSEGKGDLITLLCFTLYVALNNDPDIYDKLDAENRNFCINYLDGEGIFEECESLGEELCDNYGGQLNEEFPLELW